MVKLFFKPLQGLRGRGVEPHIRKGLLQKGLRKQGLKLHTLTHYFLIFRVAGESKKIRIETLTPYRPSTGLFPGCRRVYENKD